MRVHEHPFWYGRGMNPCIDCRILKLRKAGEFMRAVGASFLFSGEASAWAMTLLQVGRHLRRANGDKIMVARDEAEGARLESLPRPTMPNAKRLPND